MSRSTRACRALALLVICWPGVQMALVHAHDVTPWKLGGFGMYATPFPEPVDIFVGRQAQPLEPISRQGLSPVEVQTLGRVRQGRQLLADLWDPAPAAEVLSSLAGTPLRLSFRTLRLSLPDGHFRERWWHYRCDRASPAAT